MKGMKSRFTGIPFIPSIPVHQETLGHKEHKGHKEEQCRFCFSFVVFRSFVVAFFVPGLELNRPPHGPAGGGFRRCRKSSKGAVRAKYISTSLHLRHLRFHALTEPLQPSAWLYPRSFPPRTPLRSLQLGF